MKTVYAVSRWTNARRAAARHIDNGDGYPACGGAGRAAFSWEREEGEPTCKKCIRLMLAEKGNPVTHTYKIGDFVEVDFGEKWLVGVIREIYPHYGFHGGELKFEVHGTKKPYTTITSPRTIRHLTMLTPDKGQAAVNKVNNE